jgi:hypothetical protein
VWDCDVNTTVFDVFGEFVFEFHELGGPMQGACLP